MIGTIKSIILKFTPRKIVSWYHFSLAQLGALLYGYPSEKLVVIGVTGTSGKSTSVFILHSLLEGAGFAVGSLSTIAFRVGKEFQMNNRKMTMLGRFQTQKFLRKMVKTGCRYAIVETTSQGIEQFRHRGIHYDFLLFTNLYPEHIEAHGGFDNYKKAKLKLFDYLSKSKNKSIKKERIPRVIIANGDNEYAGEFLNFSVDKKFAYTIENKTVSGAEIIHIEKPQANQEGISLEIEGKSFYAPVRGMHNLKNIAAALTVGHALGISWEDLGKSTRDLPSVPGRLEYLNEGQKYDVVVDYAFEPRAMENLHDTLRPFGYKKIIQVLGGTGGGRDKARRPIIGKMAGQFATIVIVTNEDPYDEDPREIMNQVEVGVLEAGKKEGADLFVIEDRRQAIAKAISLAEPGSLVLITGKGSEQAMVGPHGKFFLWDDREVAREEIKRALSK